MPEQFGEKQHEATPHRRQQAREKGNIPKSQDLSSALVLLAALLTLYYLGGKLTTFFAEVTLYTLGEVPPLNADTGDAAALWWQILWRIVPAALPIFGLLLLAGVAVNLFQTGFLFLPDKAAPDASRISPMKGLGRIFSVTSLARLGFGIFKIVVVAGVAIASLWYEWETLLGLTHWEVPMIAKYLFEVVLWTCIKIAIVLVILALADYWFQRWKFEQDIRMTDQEMREEFKQLQGDPQVLSRRRQVQRQLAMTRLSNSVPNADVVVTNPTEYAVALKYDYETNPAPIVVAKGTDLVAQRIRRIALENDIPVVERKELARALFNSADVGEQVPAEQYAAVAEVLRYVYELKGLPLPGAA